ncbi:hypothetical protein LSAT2_018186 [Lamellibrachia satsuma]|nr:hypothetical protein LSAT2_018186 [Lamellibrachia satsuma]
MASCMTAMAALFLVFNCKLCCGEVLETVAALTRSRQGVARRKNPVKRHVFDDKLKPLPRVYVNETVWKTTGSSCVSSCETLVDSDYQSCIGCHTELSFGNQNVQTRNWDHTVATEGGYLMQVASGLIGAVIGWRRRDDDDEEAGTFLPNWETVTSMWSSAK